MRVYGRRVRCYYGYPDHDTPHLGEERGHLRHDVRLLPVLGVLFHHFFQVRGFLDGFL